MADTVSTQVLTDTTGVKFGVKLTHSQTVRMLTKTWLDDNRVSKELNNER